MAKLDGFKVICSNCNSPCELQERDNGACGDPECCGEVREWLEVSCKCGRRASTNE